MTTESRLYLDHAATTPVLPVVQQVMAEALAGWANPSSPHAEGRAARAALEDARRRIALALNWDGEVILTSGASEAISIAVSRAKVDHIVTSPVEHDAVMRITQRAQRATVGPHGRVYGASLEQALWNTKGTAGRKERALVMIQSANNETGILQDIDQLRPLISAVDGILFVDASQTAGKMPLPDADMIAISAHKLGGPPGIGALLVKDLALLQASGGQEKGYRSGTENLPAAVGFAAALEAPKTWLERSTDLRRELDHAIEAAGGKVVGKESPRIPTIASYAMPNVAQQAQLIQFDLAGISVSAGSACSSGTLKPSHVLEAMGWAVARTGGVVRVSFGPTTSRKDIHRFLDCWRNIASRPVTAPVPVYE